MAKRRKKKRPIEFSKKILYYMFIVTTFVVISTIYLVFVTNDTSPLAYLIPSVFCEFGVGTMFYYKKAEKENAIKLKQIYKDIDTDIETEIEQSIQSASDGIVG